MKKSVSLFLILTFGLAFSQIKWHTMEEALILQTSEPKKLFIHFYSKEANLDDGVLNNSVISEYIAKYFYAVKFDVKDSKSIMYMGKNFDGITVGESKIHSFARLMNISTTPSFVFIDEKLKLITSLNGRLSSIELEPYFAVISSGKYLKFKSPVEWSEFQNKFTGKIKK